MVLRAPRPLVVGLAGLFACASASAERFTDPAHGFSIEKPADWRVLTAAAIDQDHRTIESANPELRKAIISSSMPVLAFTRSAGASHGVNPTVKIAVIVSSSLEGQSGQRILEATLSSVRTLLHDVKVETAPEVVRFAGISGGHMTLTYTLQTGHGEVGIVSETWVIPRDKYYLQVGATYPSDDQTGDRDAIIELVSSLQLTN